MNYGLALSGGGTRGAAHVGVLLALEEERLLPSTISGTSAGSIVAGIYASGVPVSEMRSMVNHFNKYGTSYIDPDCINIIKLIPQIFTHQPISLTGLLKGNRLMGYLCQVTKNIEMTTVSIPVVIPAVDIHTGNTIAFTNVVQPLKLPDVIWDKQISLCEAMIASSSVPGIFKPRSIGDYCLVDGGVTNNLPVDLLIAAGEPQVIAIDISLDYETPHNNSITEVVSHSFSIMSYSLKECQSRGEILTLKPKLPKGAGLLTFDHMNACMDAGYQYTKERIPIIKKSLLSAHSASQMHTRSEGYPLLKKEM